MKRIIALALVLVMLCALCGCESNAQKMEALCGRWEMVTYLDVETAQSALELLEFYPEEIALLDLNSMGLIMTVEFTQDGTYEFAFDLDGSLEFMGSYYRSVVEDIYNGREQLTATYGEDIVNLTLEEFQQYYAELFALADYDALIQYFLETSLDYDYLQETVEKGTFRIASNTILCTIDGEEEAESMGYSIEGNTLTLTYVNGEEVYTKCN